MKAVLVPLPGSGGRPPVRTAWHPLRRCRRCGALRLARTVGSSFVLKPRRA